MTLSLRARLLAGYLALVALLSAVTFVLIERSLSDDMVADLDVRLEGQAREVTRWIENRGHADRLAPRLARVVAAEVTIVGADGRVEGSSAGGGVGQPIGDAPEVAAARKLGVGRAQRRVQAGGPTMYLVAVATPDRRAVRVAVPMAHLEERRATLRDRLLLASAIGAGVAMLLGLGAIRTVTRPVQAMTRTAERLARGDYDVAPAPPATGREDELALLSRTLAQLAAELKARIGELTAERDLSKAVVEGLVEGVIAVDAAGHAVLANRAAGVLLGELSGPEAAALPPALARLIDAARAGGEADDEIDVAGRLVRAAVRPLAGGGAVAVLYDVTQLRALGRLRRDFLASAAHELRTPVTAISGYAETLMNGSVDDASRQEFVATIHRNAQRISRLVDDLLELERLEARPERLAERAVVPLAPVIAHVVATARAAAATRGAPATIEVDVPERLAVLGDRDGLEHVIQNLVDNAIIHGGGQARVGARAEGRRVLLSVADDGPGIAAEHHALIFERFYRVDPGRSRARGGSGLGLAIVAQHVAAMGGTIRVDSAPGAGTTFTVELEGQSRGSTSSS